MPRRSRYNPEIHPQLAKWMARSGLIEVEIAAEFKIDPSTLTRWKQKYPELKNALNQSREFVDSLVEDALLKRALGYEYEETKMVLTEGGQKTKRVEKIKKAVVPDVTAQIFWLKNRQPSKWLDRQESDDQDGRGAIRNLIDAIREANSDVADTPEG